MKHIGDITQVHGYKIEPVDVIVGGSPCQDLSIAGKRAGLSGERSGLFMEQIRIVKEMREHDRSLGRANEYIRPRWMVWENVDGARSSPGGESRGKDFAAVLEEICKIHNKNARVDVPKGGWPSDSPTRMTADISDGWELRSGARESRLSQILEETAPARYYLSGKACQGILNRANRRGKKLPPMLQEALDQVISLSELTSR